MNDMKVEIWAENIGFLQESSHYLKSNSDLTRSDLENKGEAPKSLGGLVNTYQ